MMTCVWMIRYSNVDNKTSQLLEIIAVFIRKLLFTGDLRGDVNSVGCVYNSTLI